MLEYRAKLKVHFTVHKCVGECIFCCIELCWSYRRDVCIFTRLNWYWVESHLGGQSKGAWLLERPGPGTQHLDTEVHCNTPYYLALQTHLQQIPVNRSIRFIRQTNRCLQSRGSELVRCFLNCSLRSLLTPMSWNILCSLDVYSKPHAC